MINTFLLWWSLIGKKLYLFIYKQNRISFRLSTAGGSRNKGPDSEHMCMHETKITPSKLPTAIRLPAPNGTFGAPIPNNLYENQHTVCVCASINPFTPRYTRLKELPSRIFPYIYLYGAPEQTGIAASELERLYTLENVRPKAY